MSHNHLTTEERYTIEKLKSMGYARALQRDSGAISRELARYGKRKKYDSNKAAGKAKKRRKNSANGRRVAEQTKRYVVAKLKELWSPEQIVGTLRLRNVTTPASLVSVQ